MTQTSPKPKTTELIGARSLPTSPTTPKSNHWFQDLPVNRKLIWTTLAPALISVLGLGGVGAWLLHQHHQVNLSNQVKSELALITNLNPEAIPTDGGYTALYAPESIPELDPDLRQLLQSVSSSGIVTGKGKIQGTDYFLAAQQLPNNQILVRGRVNKPVNLNLLLGMTGLAVLLNLGMAWLFKEAVIERLKKLQNLAGNFQKTGGDLPLKITGKDEIGELGETFEDLAQEIQGNRQGVQLESEQGRILAEMASFTNLNANALPNILTSKLEEARSVMGLDRLLIYYLTLPEGRGRVAMEALAYGYDSTLDAEINDRCIPKALLEAYQQGRVVPVEDTANANFHPEHLDLMRRLGVKANLIVPILSQGKLFGLLIGHDCQKVHPWRQVEINFLKQLAIQIGIAIDRAAIFTKQQKEDQLQLQLQEIQINLGKANTAESIFNQAITGIRQLLQSDRVIIYRFDETWQGTIIAESLAEGWPSALGANIADPCFAEKYVEKYQQGRVQATRDIYNAGLTDCHIQQLAPFEVRANLVAPILVQDQLIGLLIAHQCSGPRNWETREIHIFAQLATQIGLALERATILEIQRQTVETERQAKEQLQQSAIQLMMNVYPAIQGDLTIEAQVTQDEIGTLAEAYNGLIADLRLVVDKAGQTADNLLDYDLVYQQLMTQFTLNNERQNQEILDSLDRLQAMTESVRNIANDAERAEQALSEATYKVEDGTQAMELTLDSMSIIGNLIAETREKVNRLEESSQKTAKAIKKIGKLAAQTHLLALKASIEAARAGEEGKGFAVIADEVRSLASQSAEATSDLEKLMAQMGGETKDLIVAMEGEREQIQEGTSLVQKTRDSLEQITLTSTKIQQIVVEIAQTALEESSNSAEMTQTMANLVAIAQETTSAAAESAASWQQLLSTGVQLQEDTAKFKVK